MKFGHLGSAAWLLIGAAAALRASDGTWIAPGGGVWSDAANWQDQAVAEGSGATATFAAAGGAVNNDMAALALRGVQAGPPIIQPSTKLAPTAVNRSAMCPARSGEMALASTYVPRKP